MSESKMSAEEMKRYYVRVHQQAIARDEREQLSAVTDVLGNKWVNRFTDYAHRLGMKRVFAELAQRWGSLAERSVLDLGCGRGRWSKDYAARGAMVTGVDISPDAVSLLAAEMPQHRFICQDISALTFPPESFDLVNSVTVLQHLPEPQQQAALTLASQWIKRGGYLVLLENTAAFDAPHVFPHRADEWIRMVESTGLKCRYCWDSNFEVLFKLMNLMLRPFRSEKPHGNVRMPSTGRMDRLSLRPRLASGAKAMLAGLSFPVEWICQTVPLARPTHSVIVFSKQPDS